MGQARATVDNVPPPHVTTHLRLGLVALNHLARKGVEDGGHRPQLLLASGGPQDARARKGTEASGGTKTSDEAPAALSCGPEHTSFVWYEVNRVRREPKFRKSRHETNLLVID